MATRTVPALIKLQDKVRMQGGAEGKVILIEPSGAHAIVLVGKGIYRVTVGSLTPIEAYPETLNDPSA
jgi:hypothetical protein